VTDCLRAAAAGIAEFGDAITSFKTDDLGVLLLFIGCLWASILVAAIAPIVGTPLVLLFWGKIFVDSTNGDR